MSWATIRDGMKTRLATISALTSSDVQPENFMEPDNAGASPGDPLIVAAGHNGMFDINIRVNVRVRRTSVELAQDALDDYVWPTGANSIKAAVEADPTLSGAVDDCAFTGVENYEVLDGATVLGTATADVLFRARVIA